MLGRPTLLALLIGGLVLAGGIALITVTTSGSSGSADRAHDAAAVSTPSSSASSPASPSATSSSAPSSTATSSSTARTSTAPKSSAARSSSHHADAKPITYTVKRGDNLTVIAKWFHVHGGVIPLYKWNKSVIGRNPNLIFRGQKIIVAPDGKISVGH